jgi:hypothetical protein
MVSLTHATLVILPQLPTIDPLETPSTTRTDYSFKRLPNKTAERFMIHRELENRKPVGCGSQTGARLSIRELVNILHSQMGKRRRWCRVDSETRRKGRKHDEKGWEDSCSNGWRFQDVPLFCQTLHSFWVCEIRTPPPCPHILTLRISRGRSRFEA